MNMKSFFVAALSSAFEQGIATSDDVLRHVTPDLLAQHLPRPLWARLLTACVGAPKVDAQLVVETIGVPNLCEHVPGAVIWACIADVAARSLGGAVPSARPGPKPLAASTAAGPIVGTETTQIAEIAETKRAPAKPLSISSPPPSEAKPTPAPPTNVGPSIPSPAAIAIGLADVVAELAAESSPPARARPPTGPRFRQTNTNIGRLAATNQRRPQASVPTPAPVDPATDRPRVRRGETEIEVEIETDVGTKDDWRNALAVEDEQLVDWSSSEETVTSTEADHNQRKR